MRLPGRPRNSPDVVPAPFGVPSGAVRFCALLLVLVLAAFTGSCNKPPARPDGGAAIRLQLWTISLKPGFADFINGLIAEFEKENPGITVEWVDVPQEFLDRRLMTAGAAGQSPDVVNLASTFGLFASMGALAELDDKLTIRAEETYVAGAVQSCRVDGKLLAVPWYLTTQARLMNAQQLEAGGLSTQTLASDWTQLRQQSRAYHAKTGRFLFTVRMGTDSDLPVFLMQDGLAPLRAKPGGGLESNLDDPRICAAIADWVDLYRAGAMPTEAATKDFNHLTDNYNEGKVAMINTGLLDRVQKNSPQVFEQTVVGPSAVGSQGKANLSIMYLVVMRQSRHPREAARLAEFMSSPRWQEKLADNSTALPSTAISLSDGPDAWLAKAALKKMQPKDPAKPFTPAEQLAAEKMRDLALINGRQARTAVAYRVGIRQWPAMVKIFEEEIKSQLLTKRAPDLDGALDRVSKKWNAILDDAGPTLTPAVLPPGVR